VGYEVLDVKEDGDEGGLSFPGAYYKMGLTPCEPMDGFLDELMVDTVPPVSVFYPPNSHPALLRLIPQTLPPKSLAVCQQTGPRDRADGRIRRS